MGRRHKAALNLTKHDVAFEEAASVFADPLAAIFDDEFQSADEIIVGHSENNRLVLVCFAERDGMIRIISARRATKRERKDYEENQ